MRNFTGPKLISLLCLFDNLIKGVVFILSHYYTSANEVYTPRAKYHSSVHEDRNFWLLGQYFRSISKQGNNLFYFIFRWKFFFYETENGTSIIYNLLHKVWDKWDIQALFGTETNTCFFYKHMNFDNRLEYA